MYPCPTSQFVAASSGCLLHLSRHLGVATGAPLLPNGALERHLKAVSHARSMQYGVGLRIAVANRLDGSTLCVCVSAVAAAF